jgi:hypothetical protein
MSLLKSLLFIVTLHAAVASANESAKTVPVSPTPSVVSATVGTNVPLQIPQEREWYRTAVLFLGIAAVSATFIHGLSTKRQAS